MQFLSCLADVLGFTLFACQTVHNIRSLTGDSLFDAECLICLCDMNGLTECPFNTCIAPYIVALGEPDRWWRLRCFVRMHLCEVDLFTLRGFEIPATLLTLGGMSVSISSIQWCDDVVVTWQSPTHKHIVQISIPLVCYCWRMREKCFASFT